MATTWACLTNGTTTLTLDTVDPYKAPPKVVGRNVEGGPGRSAATSITGRVVVSEITKTQALQTLKLRWEYLSDTDASTIRTILSAALPITVKLYPAGSGISCIPAPDAEQKWEPGLDDDWPERLLDGTSTQPTWRTWWRVELTLYRIS